MFDFPRPDMAEPVGTTPLHLVYPMLCPLHIYRYAPSLPPFYVGIKPGHPQK